MSVLSFPRIYFNGYMMWDPSTANNNDYSTIYDAANADLDWDFLAKQTPPITRDNFQDTFRNWDITPVEDVCKNPSPSDTIQEPPLPSVCPDENPDTDYHMGSRWGYYGGSGCGFLDYTASDPTYTKKTLTSGGATAYQQPAAAGDAILGKPVVMEGDMFGGHVSLARLIDINPMTPFCSQVFFSKFMIGDEQTHISAPREQRMFSRAFIAPRNISSKLMIAGGIGVIFQTAMSFESLEILNGGNSNLLSSLQEAMQSSGAEGLMIRFSIYNTLYYQNGVYNDIKKSEETGVPNPSTACELSKMWQAGEVFHNPAYSRAAGVVGVWNTGELSSVPGGHQLVPVSRIVPVSSDKKARTRAGSFLGIAGKGLAISKDTDEENKCPPDHPVRPAPPGITQGTTWVEIDSSAGLVSLDMMNTIVESSLQDVTNDGTKFNYGEIRVGVLTGSTFNQIGSFDFNHYNLTAYLSQSGLVDVPFDRGVSVEMVQSWLRDGGVALQVEQNGVWTTFLEERTMTADTDDRGVYLDQGETAEITVQVRYKNGAPPPNTFLHFDQYFPFPLFAGSGVLMLFPPAPPEGGGTPSWDPSTPVCERTPNPDEPYVKFVNGGENRVIPVTVAPGQDWGEATIQIQPNYPGFPNIVFYPFQDSVYPEPAPQPAITFGFDTCDATQKAEQFLIGNTGYSSVRVMPFDTVPLDGKVSPLVDFVDCWNATGPYAGQPQYNRVAIWKWLYGNVLYIYDMLFPVMDAHMPLHNLQRVEGAADQLITMIQKDWVDDSTLYMPITRDLSAAKRLILETWCNLAIRKYPQEPLPPLELST